MGVHPVSRTRVDFCDLREDDRIFLPSSCGASLRWTRGEESRSVRPESVSNRADDFDVAHNLSRAQIPSPPYRAMLSPRHRRPVVFSCENRARWVGTASRRTRGCSKWQAIGADEPIAAPKDSDPDPAALSPVNHDFCGITRGHDAVHGPLVAGAPGALRQA